MLANSINGTTFKLFKVNADGSTTRVIDVMVMLSSDGLKATLNPPSLHLRAGWRPTRVQGHRHDPGEGPLVLREPGLPTHLSLSGLQSRCFEPRTIECGVNGWVI